MKIESHDVSLEKLLQGNYFLIPRFQRPYSWDAEQVQEFWDDILSNFNESYFIGSMVVFHAGKNLLAVVDGQQRLTTISIFLSAIRNEFLNLGNEDSALGLQQFIERKNRDNKETFVLQTESSFPYLQEEVFKIEPADVPLEIGNEEKAIARAFSIFTNSIKAKIALILSDVTIMPDAREEEALKWLRQLRDTILELSIILVSLDDEDDAYLIFETLNTRGKDLALSDLLKNHFSKLLKPKGDVDNTSLKWRKVLEVIAGSDLGLDPDTFIVHSWQSRYDFVTKGKAFKKIRTSVKKQNAKVQLDQFVSDARMWRSIFEPDYLFEKSERDAKKALEALRLFRVTQPVPALLSLIRSYQAEEIRLRSLIKALKAIERFHFAFTAVTSSRSSGGISGMYSSFGRKLFDATDQNVAGAEIAALISKLQERVPPPPEFDAGFEQIFYTKTHASQKALVKYILMKTAEHEKQPMIGHSDELTIEHLSPQSWMSDEDQYVYCGQVGNLILVDSETNELLGNKPFLTKKEILNDRGYKLPALLQDADVLDEQLLYANTKRVAQLARSEIWKI